MLSLETLSLLAIAQYEQINLAMKKKTRVQVKYEITPLSVKFARTA